MEPGACYQPDVLQQKRLWGFMVQLYGLRSERNWGIGDFTDLRNLADIAAELGAGVIGVNPLHATQGSPYSPSSRHALNVLYIDVEALPGFESSDKLRKRLRALRESELVDYEGVRAGEARSARGHLQEDQAEGRGFRELPGVRGAAREVRRRLAELAAGVFTIPRPRR